MSLAPSRAGAVQVGSVVAEVVPGRPRPRLGMLSCSGALALRSAGDALYLVGAGAHPIGGDETTVRLTLAEGATARVTSVGATLARRGAGEELSSQRVDLVLGEHTVLDWAPEPGIAAFGCHHRSRTVVEMAGTARCSLAEEVVLGRHGEEPGSWTTRTEVVAAGRPILVSELGLGPAHRSWGSSASFAGARALTSLVVVDPFLPPEVFLPSTVEGPGGLGVALPLAGPGIELLAWADELGRARDLLGRLSEEGRRSGWRAPS